MYMDGLVLSIFFLLLGIFFTLVYIVIKDDLKRKH